MFLCTLDAGGMLLPKLSKQTCKANSGNVIFLNQNVTLRVVVNREKTIEYSSKINNSPLTLKKSYLGEKLLCHEFYGKCQLFSPSKKV